VPTRSAREFYSGTENVYSDKPLFAGLETAVGAQIRIEPAGGDACTRWRASSRDAADGRGDRPLRRGGATIPRIGWCELPLPAPAGGPLLFAFSEPVYEVASGQDSRSGCSAAT